MLRETVRKRLVPMILQKPFDRVLSDGDVPVTVAIHSLSWYRSKGIYVGKVVNCPEPHLLGQRVIGSLKLWFDQHAAAVEEAGIVLSEDEIAYLSEPWDIENPTTAHELTASRVM